MVRKCFAKNGKLHARNVSKLRPTICYFQTSTNVYNLRVSMVRAVTLLGRSNVIVMLGGQDHYAT